MSNEDIYKGVEFVKIHTNRYKAYNVQALLDLAKNMVDDISYGEPSTYEGHSNKLLLDSLISRMISSAFFYSLDKLKVDMPTNYPFVAIEVPILDDTIVVSTGLLSLDKQIYKVNGVLYN